MPIGLTAISRHFFRAHKAIFCPLKQTSTLPTSVLNYCQEQELKSTVLYLAWPVASSFQILCAIIGALLLAAYFP